MDKLSRVSQNVFILLSLRKEHLWLGTETLKDTRVPDAKVAKLKASTTTKAILQTIQKKREELGKKADRLRLLPMNNPDMGFFIYPIIRRSSSNFGLLSELFRIASAERMRESRSLSLSKLMLALFFMAINTLPGLQPKKFRNLALVHILIF
jgi:hypothetical protein